MFECSITFQYPSLLIKIIKLFDIDCDDNWSIHGGPEGEVQKEKKKEQEVWGKSKKGGGEEKIKKKRTESRDGEWRITNQGVNGMSISHSVIHKTFSEANHFVHSNP